jgi:hypothetical protein
MFIMGTTSALVHSPSPAVRRITASTLLDSIAAYLNHDGAYVDPASIDSGGMWIHVDGFRFRLALDAGELMDDTEWRRYQSTDAGDACIGGADDDLLDMPF